MHRELPWVVVDAVLDVGGTYVRVMTTHFPPWQKCTEIPDMVRQTRFMVDRLLHTSHRPSMLDRDLSDLPTIVTGDLNIRSQELSPQILIREWELDIVNTQDTNTLNPRLHPWFQFNIPKEGYHVDHMFQKWFEVENWKVDTEADTSDHLPLEAQLKLKED